MVKPNRKEKKGLEKMKTNTIWRNETPPRERETVSAMRLSKTWMAVVLAAGLFLVCARGLWAEKDPSDEVGKEVSSPSAQTLQTTREALKQWVETRKVISKEKQDLALAREMLQERIDVVQGRIEALQEKTVDARKSISEAEGKRDALAAENDALNEAASSLEETVTKLEARTKAMLRKLPEAVRKDDLIEPLSKAFPDDPAKTDLSLSQRFQNVVGVINQLNKLSREIKVTSEVRQLPDGSKAEVTTMYLGVSQAYYVSAKQDIAGVGAPSPEGWTWRPANEIASRVAQAVAMLRNERPAAFVQLPTEIK
jgi:FtsZ-binding cell division protein ZapB